MPMKSFIDWDRCVHGIIKFWLGLGYGWRLGLSMPSSSFCYGLIVKLNLMKMKMKEFWKTRFECFAQASHTRWLGLDGARRKWVPL